MPSTSTASIPDCWLQLGKAVCSPAAYGARPPAKLWFWTCRKCGDLGFLGSVVVMGRPHLAILYCSDGSEPPVSSSLAGADAAVSNKAASKHSVCSRGRAKQHTAQVLVELCSPAGNCALQSTQLLVILSCCASSDRVDHLCSPSRSLSPRLVTSCLESGCSTSARAAQLASPKIAGPNIEGHCSLPAVCRPTPAGREQPCQAK